MAKNGYEYNNFQDIKSKGRNNYYTKIIINLVHAGMYMMQTAYRHAGI